MKTKLLLLLLFTFATNVFAALDTPTEDFIDNNDGTVTHKKTGLTWQRCSVGQTWTGSSCSGTASTFTWNDAMAQTSNFLGDNWKLPCINDLVSIVEYQTGGTPAINNSIFPNTPLGSFWSASVYSTDKAWYVSSDGSSKENYKSYKSGIIRFVRGGQSCSDSYTPTADFTDNQDGTVTHKKTGLSWQRCSVGQIWDGTSCTGVASTVNYATAIKLFGTLSGKDVWRLPTLSELETIVEYNYSPSINSIVFSNTSNDYFWSASYAGYGSLEFAWSVKFFSGGQSLPINATYNQPVRLVRGTWSAPTIATPVVSTTIDLSATLSQSNSRVKINENLTYTATVINNGTGVANNSLLKIYLPPRNVSVVSMPSDCVTTGKSLTCSLGNLAAGANASRAITVNYIKSGGASVGALALTDSEDMNSDNNFSRVVTAIKK